MIIPRSTSLRALGIAPIVLVAASTVATGDWSNLGGNARRNGLTSAVGPETPTLRWSGASYSVTPWTPLAAGNRVFSIRQEGWPNPDFGPGYGILHARDLATGATLWTYDFPWEPGDFNAVLYGVNNGRVFVGRSSNGLSHTSPIHCLDASTGALLWVSGCDTCSPGIYDGVVFADNGDLIATAGYSLRRISGSTGAVLWTAPIVFSIVGTGAAGPIIVGNKIYIHERSSNNGIRIGCYSALTGAKLYASPHIPVFVSDTNVFAGSDGMVFFPVCPRVGPKTDRMYAYQDTGNGLVLRWSSPCYSRSGEHAVTADGGVVLMNFDGKLEIRDQLTGTLRAMSSVTVSTPSLYVTSTHIAVDGAGKIFFGNGGFPGTVFAFNPDLTLRWSIMVPELDQGGPVLADDGTLLVAATGTDFRAYYDPPCVQADLNCDGAVNAQDLAALLGAWGGSGAGDLNGDGSVGAQDLAILLGAWS